MTDSEVFLVLLTGYLATISIVGLLLIIGELL